MPSPPQQVGLARIAAQRLQESALGLCIAACVEQLLAAQASAPRRVADPLVLVGVALAHQRDVGKRWVAGDEVLQPAHAAVVGRLILQVGPFGVRRHAAGLRITPHALQRGERLCIAAGSEQHLRQRLQQWHIARITAVQFAQRTDRLCTPIRLATAQAPVLQAQLQAGWIIVEQAAVDRQRFGAATTGSEQARLLQILLQITAVGPPEAFAGGQFTGTCTDLAQALQGRLGILQLLLRELHFQDRHQGAAIIRCQHAQPRQGVFDQALATGGLTDAHLLQQPLALLGDGSARRIGQGLRRAGPGTGQSQQDEAGRGDQRMPRTCHQCPGSRRLAATQRSARHSRKATISTTSVASTASSAGWSARWYHSSSHHGSAPT